MNSPVRSARPILSRGPLNYLVESATTEFEIILSSAITAATELSCFIERGLRPNAKFICRNATNATLNRFFAG